MKKIPVIFFLGKSGSGKDTQAQLLIERFGFLKISSGEILRELSSKAEDPKYAEVYEYAEIKQIIDGGKFVPTLTIACNWYGQLLDLMKRVRHSPDEAPAGIVFTGSPRKIAEAWIFDDFFGTWPDAKKFFETKAILVSLSTEEAHARLSKRRICADCKKIFLGTEKAIEKGICDACGGKLIRRVDDNFDGIESRMEEFRTFVEPVIDFYKEKECLTVVNGEQAIEGVHNDIMKIIRI